MSINSDFIVAAFIKEARKILLKSNNLDVFSKIYTYKKTKTSDPWEPYSSSDWEEEKAIKNKLNKIVNIDQDIWVIELDDKKGNSPNF